MKKYKFKIIKGDYKNSSKFFTIKKIYKKDFKPMYYSFKEITSLSSKGLTYHPKIHVERVLKIEE